MHPGFKAVDVVCGRYPLQNSSHPRPVAIKMVVSPRSIGEVCCENLHEAAVINSAVISAGINHFPRLPASGSFPEPFQSNLFQCLRLLKARSE